MSILIRGMEMPKAGQIVLVEIDENGDVFAAYDGGRTKLTQHKAVPVPPHGRLIDAETLIDAIIAKYIRHERHRELVFAVVQIKQDMVDIINNAPTIIPADKEGEG